MWVDGVKLNEWGATEFLAPVPNLTPHDTIVIISYVGVMAVLPSFGLPVGIIAGATRRARASAFRYAGRYVDSMPTSLHQEVAAERPT